MNEEYLSAAFFSDDDAGALHEAVPESGQDRPMTTRFIRSTIGGATLKWLETRACTCPTVAATRNLRRLVVTSGDRHVVEVLT